MNEVKSHKAKARRKLKKQKQEQRDKLAREIGQLGTSEKLIRLKASTVRAAKMQTKRLYPEGGEIIGYISETFTNSTDDAADRAVYRATVLPNHLKGPGGRRVFSNREEYLKGYYPTAGHYPKGTDTSRFFSKPNYFIYYRSIGDVPCAA